MSKKNSEKPSVYEVEMRQLVLSWVHDAHKIGGKKVRAELTEWFFDKTANVGKTYGKLFKLYNQHCKLQALYLIRSSILLLAETGGEALLAGLLKIEQMCAECGVRGVTIENIADKIAINEIYYTELKDKAEKDKGKDWSMDDFMEGIIAIRKHQNREVPLSVTISEYAHYINLISG